MKSEVPTAVNMNSITFYHITSFLRNVGEFLPDYAVSILQNNN
jgi:hypothetical protein